MSKLYFMRKAQGVLLLYKDSTVRICCRHIFSCCAAIKIFIFVVFNRLFIKLLSLFVDFSAQLFRVDFATASLRQRFSSTS